jgi:hypothetical protein
LGLVYDATEIEFDKEALYASDPLVGPAEMNLSTFFGNGGKLIFFRGDSDPWLSCGWPASLRTASSTAIGPTPTPTDQLVRVGSP